MSHCEELSSFAVLGDDFPRSISFKEEYYASDVSHFRQRTLELGDVAMCRTNDEGNIFFKTPLGNVFCAKISSDLKVTTKKLNRLLYGKWFSDDSNIVKENELTLALEAGNKKYKAKCLLSASKRWWFSDEFGVTLYIPGVENDLDFGWSPNDILYKVKGEEIKVTMWIAMGCGNWLPPTTFSVYSSRPYFEHMELNYL